MARVATTSTISNPKRYGYDVRIDNILLRSAVGATPDAQMIIQSSRVDQEQQVNVRSNPEDFTSNVGRIYSRNKFEGGQGLDTAHNANGNPNDVTRFWDSKNIDVFHGDDETSYNIHLLYTTTEKLNLTNNNNYIVRTTNGRLYVSDGTAVYESTDDGDTFNAMLSTGITYDITGMASFGDDIYITTGDGTTNTEFLQYDYSATSWTTHSNAFSGGYFTGVWFVKGRLIVTGNDGNAEYLWEADPFDSSFSSDFNKNNTLVKVEPTHQFTDVTDGGAAILVCSTNGNIYSLKEDLTTLALVVQGISNIGFEEVNTIEASEGIIFFGTKEAASNIGRFYRADLVVADDLYVLANRQLIKEWTESVNSSPHSMYASRDSIYLGVQESTNETNLWRYYLPTGGFARDLVVTHNGADNNAKALGIVRAGTTDSKFIIAVEGQGLYKETSTYATTGYLIMSAADFYTAESKQFVGAEVSTFTLDSNTDVELQYSTKFEALDNPNDNSFKTAFVQATGTGDTEKQIAEVSRYIIGKIILNSNGTNTPKVKSVQFRALARPELVVAQIPVNISDRVERPNRKPINIKGLGETIYSTLRDKEGNSVTLELFNPSEIIRGVIENISYPIFSNPDVGSVTQYAIITVRGTRQPVITDVSSPQVFGINALGFIRFGA